MKLVIKQILLIFLIGTISSLKLTFNRREGGSGTWESGYICPKIKIWVNKENVNNVLSEKILQNFLRII